MVSLSTHARGHHDLDDSQPHNGTGVVQSIGLSPDSNEVLAVLNGLGFPGDVMATIDTSTQSITSTVNLETGTDSMGQLVSDGTLDYVWVTDETNGGDVIQNLNLAVSDPASQPYVTAVGGTSFGHGTPTLGPPPTETGVERPALLLRGRRRRRDLADLRHAVVPAGAGHGHGSSGTPCADVERRLPRDPRRVGRRRPEHRLHRLRQPSTWVAGTPWAGRAAPRRCGRRCWPSSPRPTGTPPATAR